ncbi:glycolate oxidase FAD binding subunit [Variovorax boronicumulans]|uniref:glycolate oxidase subunit GlcE n=1 Tax=Variovorax boronicumulans TaxID=436515 RepID=UPI0027832970|nr:glycolate oxidase subunit GlcE [Variovorax boronicumulans]MDP9995829.1 glycolate oxidase FAD binding subunit [Variovorax boronicumulans]MDQ0006967.1 glycolate oxidase FAD binding subunit [Variovorax boronicumulans]
MDSALHQIVERIRAAAADATPLCIRGGGTKDFYGEALQGDILDTTALTGITNYEPSELVVTVRAGTPLAELEAALAEKGQCLPFEPPHFGSGGTVGGMVAAGLSGPARASVGAVRDYVLGATLINGRGDVLSFGGQVMKNVAGYDVSRVLAGSLGTLGVIAEVSLKVLPVAPAEATLEFACSQADALRLLNEWGGRPLPLNASCWFEYAGAGALYLRLRGAVAAVEAACTHLGGERKDNARAAADWQALCDQQLPWFDVASGPDALWRLSVPQTAPVLAIDGNAPLIEWHGGQRWYKAPPDQAARIREIAHAAGGHATLFRTPASDIPRFDAMSAPIARIHRALMQEFDPHRIFNRGRLFADA